ncbi:MAG: S24 family peptidase [Clostridia bacterium]
MSMQIDNFSNRLKKAMSLRNIKPIDLSEKTKISKSKISSYMSGRFQAKQDGVYTLSVALNVDPVWLMGYDVPIKKEEVLKNEKKYIRIPVFGSIPAGTPIELIEDIITYEDLSEDYLKGGKEYFGLKIKGNSMEPKYLNNDTLIILKQSDCDSGQDAIVMVNGDDGTFKRVFKSDSGITLQPLNNEYMPVFYFNEDVINKPVKILGIVKEIRRSI